MAATGAICGKIGREKQDCSPDSPWPSAEETKQSHILEHDPAWADLTRFGDKDKELEVPVIQGWSRSGRSEE